MIDPIRQEVLRHLERVSELAPEVRFGQLIANLAFFAAGPWDKSLWDLEDDQLLAALKQHLADLSRRQQNTARHEADTPGKSGELASGRVARR